MSDETALDRLDGLVNTERLRQWRVPIGVLLLVVLLRPVLRLDFVLGGDYIATTILVWMLFAAAYNLLLGYTGLLSFGHAMFLGAGLYGVAIGLAKFNLPYVVGAAIGIAVATVLAYVIGRLTVQRGEIYFAMLTLAFGMAAHFIVNADPFGLTGGADGLRAGAVPSWIASFRGEKLVELPFIEFEYYYLAAGMFTVGMLLLWQIARSPFGRTLLAIRDNEDLARSMGVATFQYKVRAFTLSGAFAALAGTMLVIRNNGAGLEDISAVASGDVLLMTIFGGSNYFFGPMVGVFTWFVGRETLTTLDVLALPAAELPLVTLPTGGVLTYWQFFFGLVFVIAVLVAPQEGIWGFIRGRFIALGKLLRRWSR